MNTTNAGLANVGLQSLDGAGREGGSNNIILGEKKEKSISITSCVVDSTTDLPPQSAGSAKKIFDGERDEVKVAVEAASEDVQEESPKTTSLAEEGGRSDNDNPANVEMESISDAMDCSSIETSSKVNNNDAVSSASSSSGMGEEEAGATERNSEKTQQNTDMMASEAEVVDAKQQIAGNSEADITINSEQGVSNSIIPTCNEEKEPSVNVPVNDVPDQLDVGDKFGDGSENGKIQFETFKSEENTENTSPELDGASQGGVDNGATIHDSDVAETNESSTRSLQSVKPHAPSLLSDDDKLSPKPSDPSADGFVDELIIPKSPTPTFARAFSDDYSSCEAPIEGSRQQAMLSTSAPMEASAPMEVSEVGSDSANHDEVGHSQTAFGAAKKKKMNKGLATYLETVKQEPKTGSSVESPRCEKPAFKDPFSPESSSKVVESGKSHLKDSVVTDALPGLKSVRERFEKNSKQSESNVFEFGEAFREKMKHKQMAEKEKFKEAIVVMRGFDEDEITTTPRSPGEVDTSNLEKNYVCRGNEMITLADGRSRVDYEMRDYRAMVFIVHRRRGLILLQNQPGRGAAYTIPGGKILKDEFMIAAKQVGSRTEQLQSAGRQGAAREVFNMTGIDVREEVDRLVPAVLRSKSDVDSNGHQVARNDLCECHFYFLTISEDDFLQEAPDDNSSLSSPSAEPNSPYRLKLSSDIKGFDFVDSPVAAFKIMKEKGDENTADALQIIIGHQAPSDMAENFHSLSQRNLLDVEKAEVSSQNQIPSEKGNQTTPKQETAPESKCQHESEQKFLSEPKGLLVQPDARKVEACCCSLM